MPPKTRSIKTSHSDNENHTYSEANSSHEVFTYLDETMRSISYSKKDASDLEPWLLYGPPDSPLLLADMELSNLQVMSLKDYKDIIPVQLSFVNGTRTPDLYYLIIEYFSSLSNVHDIYCRTTPEGFVASFSGSESSVNQLQCTLDFQFSKLMRLCFADQTCYPFQSFNKYFVDTQVIPELINNDLNSESFSVGIAFHEYATKASEGDLLPFVKFCVAHNHLRSDICIHIYSLLIARVQSNDLDSFECIFSKFFKSTGDFLKATITFTAELKSRNLLHTKLAAAKWDNNNSHSRSARNRNTFNKGHSNRASSKKPNKSNNQGKTGGKPKKTFSNSLITKSHVGK